MVLTSFCSDAALGRLMVMTLHWETYDNDLICNGAALEELW